MLRTRRLFSQSSSEPDAAADHATPENNVRLAQLVQAYKSHGHLLATVDPLKLAYSDPLRAPYYVQDVPVLQPEYYGLRCDREMLGKTFWIGNALEPLLQGPHHKLSDILATLRKVYTGNIGSQFAHILRPDCVEWLNRRVIEHSMVETSPTEKRDILSKISHATLFEEFCGSRLSGAKRFSLEGCEALIPGLEALLEESAARGVRAIEMGMTHRGRLNVLKNVMHVPLAAVVHQFQPYLPDDDEHPNNSDDVRYHLGTSVVRMFGYGSGTRELRVSLAANPSHLESVNSVVLGKTRARQFLMRGSIVEDDSGANLVGQTRKRGSVDYSPSDDAKRESMAVLLHGDASFYQGSVREVLGFSNLRDYTTGGTVHIIINNQIGFTTLPKESHSSVYCSDVALSIGAPVFHVNGDDPEAFVRVCRTAAEYRQRFGRDCIINLWGYRRHGHNEMDDPGLTQPIMYNVVNRLPRLMDLYSRKLVHEGVVSDQDAVESEREAIVDSYKASFSDFWKDGQEPRDEVTSYWNELGMLTSQGHNSNRIARRQLLQTTVTGVHAELLRSYGRAIFTLPADYRFKVHPKVREVFQQRLSSIEVGAGKTIRWATAEALAFASLLEDGFHIRLSGQDVERGTFNQRHGVLCDQERSERGNERIYKPWTNLQLLSWHQEDIRRDLVKRANSQALLPSTTAGGYSKSGKGSGSTASHADEETDFAAGIYNFPSEKEGGDHLPETDFYAGLYRFGGDSDPATSRSRNGHSGPKVERRVVRPGQSSLDSPSEEEEYLDEDEVKVRAHIESELHSIQKGLSRRACDLRNLRKVLRWREPTGKRKNAPELGIMEICNSPLSEEAVLGFEHGYSLYSPNIMAIWEAQFGDFSNCAQTIIDTFIANGEEKWVRSSGVVLLLPHGYEGQGPDHSSAKIERFLQLCAEDPTPPLGSASLGAQDELNRLAKVNMHVLNPSTPAQYFHALRRQMMLPVRKPLIIFTPKYLLHHRPCSSSLDELGRNTRFHTVLQDPAHDGHGMQRRNVRKVLLCSGKMYYHLAQKRAALGMQQEVAIIRIEQLSPFPFHSVRHELSKYLYNNDAPYPVELVWVQEEPKNMGAWTYVNERLRWVLVNMPLSDVNMSSLLERPSVAPIAYCGRPVAASPATGSFELHRKEMNDIVNAAFAPPKDV
ncbi:2-oxoglutarate dehydrogenase, mitochondrial [Hondaea fermentalgiana]|uniref:2-oxoglutarate dehydrogenase, mitochondrial n=1 Tax=Hondaea fermentalgiana TaxID=2315210 RepID=A0A2R5G532_9STRA|nr:2-oxoglutarate dehydrogenase, mitochondrial [Hondaea fermentalgiana]|eukprot:GBG26142.1 2-oxoglutarate dehydrogenase, mitochondrial [Hondaea fermentalgiana]